MPMCGVRTILYRDIYTKLYLTEIDENMPMMALYEHNIKQPLHTDPDETIKQVTTHTENYMQKQKQKYIYIYVCVYVYTYSVQIIM